MSYINLTISEGNYYDVDEPITLYSWEEQVSLNGYSVLSQDTQLTVSNLASADDNCYIRIFLDFYKNVDGRYVIDTDPYYLTYGGGFIPIQLGAEPFGGLVELRPGESFTFSLSGLETSEDYNGNVVHYDFLVVNPRLYYLDAEETWSAEYCFTID